MMYHLKHIECVSLTPAELVCESNQYNASTFSIVYQICLHSGVPFYRNDIGEVGANPFVF